VAAGRSRQVLPSTPTGGLAVVGLGPSGVPPSAGRHRGQEGADGAADMPVADPHQQATAVAFPSPAHPTPQRVPADHGLAPLGRPNPKPVPRCSTLLVGTLEV
jgi:hypothetical protein